MAIIFVIDDEPILLDLISNVLQLAGHEVSVFSDPRSVIDVFLAGSPQVDLLLTDIQMRPMNGTDFAKVLMDHGFTGPILFMSGYPSGGNGNGVANGHWVLDKPFTAPELRAAVDRALAAGLPRTHHAS